MRDPRGEEGTIPYRRRQVDERPGDVTARLQLADALGYWKRYEEAQEQIVTALKAAPLDPRPHFYLGVLLLAEGDHAAAVIGFQEALELLRRLRAAEHEFAGVIVEPHARLASAGEDGSIRLWQLIPPGETSAK